MIQNTKSAWELLEARGTPDLQTKNAVDVLDFASHEISTIESRKRRIETEYAVMFARWYGGFPTHPTPSSMHFPTLASRALKAASWAAGLTEAFAGAVVTAYAAGPHHRAVGFAVGMLLAGLLSVAAIGAASSILGRYEEQPMRARRFLLSAFTILLLPWVCALAPVLAARTVAGPALVALFPWMLTILMIISPALAGVSAALSRLFGWSEHLAAEWHRCDKYVHGVTRLASYAHRVHSAFAELPFPKLKRITVIVVMLALVTTPALVGAQSGFGVVLRDHSKSLDLAEVRLVDSLFAADFQRITEIRRVRTWDVVPFTADAFTARAIRRITLKWNEEKCPTLAHGEIDWLLESAKKVEQEDVARRCDAIMLANRRRRNDALASASHLLRESLRQIVPENSRCTSVRDALWRASMLPPGSTAVIITDGEESCAPSERPITVPKTGTHVIVLLVPRRGGVRSRSADAFFTATSRLHKIARWAEIRSPSELGTLQTLASEVRN